METTTQSGKDWEGQRCGESTRLRGEDAEEKQHEHRPCSNAGFTTFLIGLLSGTLSTLLCKMAYDCQAAGLDGKEKSFDKPIMMVTLLFVGLLPAIPFWYLQQSSLPVEEREHVTYQMLYALTLPSICDFLCTLLLLIAQLYITASLWQMMRGSVIIITALLKRYALHHHLNVHMWMGVGLITFSMLLVACDSFFNPNNPATPGDKDPRIGILLVLLGCLAQGVQYVFEEKVMDVDNASPLIVIGCEGVWGTVLSLCVVYPIAYYLPGDDNGKLEDFYDAVAMMTDSTAILVLSLGFMITVSIYNVASVYVTLYLSSIWHAILDNFRPVTVWAADLAIFFVILPGQGFGEPWTAASWLQLSGLLLLLVGTAMYNGSIMTFADMDMKAQQIAHGRSYTKLSSWGDLSTIEGMGLVSVGSSTDRKDGIKIRTPMSIQQVMNDDDSTGVPVDDYTIEPVSLAGERSNNYGSTGSYEI